MARLQISQDKEFLIKKSKPVEVFGERLHQLLNDMNETLKAANGVGLAAPQVGVLWRACLVETPDGILELINPVILRESNYRIGGEGCLSFPKAYGNVNRPNKVTIRAQNRHGKWFEIKLTKLSAVCASHEIDHLEGILFIDKIIGEQF